MKRSRRVSGLLLVAVAVAVVAVVALAAGVPGAPVGGTGPSMPTAADAADPGSGERGPRNVIVMISDGWGYNQVAATDLFQHGRTGAQVYERFPVRAAMSTYPAGGGYDPVAAWASFDHVRSGATDSAAAATAMSTGVKTYDGGVGVDPAGARLVHAFARAEESGRATGVVSSVPLSHATPAGFVAHNADRDDYAGIAREMIYQGRTDVIMGGGHPCYDADGAGNGCTGTTQYVGGVGAWADLTDGDGALGADADGDGDRDPWTLVQSRADFAALAGGQAPRRVIGVPRVSQTLQQGRRCAVTATNPRTGVDACVDAPYAVPRTDSVPTLAEMARAAVNVLDADPDGFALMIEGGAVDWANHGNAPGRMVEELVDFNRAVEAVVEWIESNGGWEDTLLVVTGDHESGYLTGPGGDPDWTPVVARGQGAMPLVEYHHNGHTNSLVPLFARGNGAGLLAAAADGRDPRRGDYLDNTELGQVLHRLLG